ncbi:MAG TPA: 16S rRNA (guanine(527)-N(7))-methyltransferase RsmG [Moraxellaceae bacterium]|nr:16S rRNA (guanine(527)-N(7))-methyltransferase RsmG [Moraxellaceae bacterium]
MNNVLAGKLHDGIAELGLTDLPAGTEDRLLAYLALLVKWNGAYNLTAVRDPAQMLVKHLLDSLSVLPHVKGETLIDVGTGAGLPGLVLALARPALRVTLLDSNGKKVRFLRQVIAELGIGNAEAVQSRVEEFAGHYDVVTSRAFATLADMVEWSGHLAGESGEFLAMKGVHPAEEIAALPAGFRATSVVSLTVPFLEEARHLVHIVHDDARH